MPRGISNHQPFIVGWQEDGTAREQDKRKRSKKK
jgi:hypothetical protein